LSGRLSPGQKTATGLSPDRNTVFNPSVFPIVTELQLRCHNSKLAWVINGSWLSRPAVKQMNYAPPIPRLGVAAITENLLKRKWSATILRYLEKGVSDPAEISRHEINLSTKVMSERLRTMLRYGLLARFPRPAPSTVIEYRLTPLGKALLDMINAIDELDQQLIKSKKSMEQSFGLNSVPAPDLKVPPPASVLKKSNRNNRSNINQVRSRLTSTHSLP
jgi:DNA-binding HxlR family transcriptional regulator